VLVNKKVLIRRFVKKKIIFNYSFLERGACPKLHLCQTVCTDR
jgi:hypothetical protein